MEPEVKELSTRLFNEEKEKKEKEKKDKKDKKDKVNIDTDEVEVLDDVEDIDGLTINIKEQLKNYIKKELNNINKK